MYRIIDHKRYDTETALMIAEIRYTETHEYGDEFEVRECLYQTSNGALFISEWPAETIHPTTATEAVQWAEQWQDRDGFDIDAVIEALGGMEALGIVDA